ncbi:hypothetical protein [Arachidicoccus sp.]|uniref:hypothetical protein n=1 Tax=Arachidicoccus sp. TaxID=1872624 RepID=UPI003D1EC70C
MNSFIVHFILSIKYLSCKDKIQNVILPNYIGELLSNTRKHYANNNYTTAAVTITDGYSYDHAGRMLATTEQINNQTPVALASETPDLFKLGQQV